MNLTERRKQFLHSLVDLYHRTNLPVHYETLASALGVSKWTAYDMLKELEKQGLLTRDYAVNTGETGRSQVVFRPSANAEALFAQPRRVLSDEADLASIRQEVTVRFQRLKGLPLSEAIQDTLAEIPRVEARVTFYAYMVGMMLILLNSLNESTVALVKRLVESTPEVKMRLAVFVGTMVGTVLQSGGIGISAELADLVGNFVKALPDLTEGEQEMLAGFLAEGLG